MDVKTAFNIEQEVHFIKYDKVRVGKITRITLDIIKDEIHTMYKICYTPNSVEPNKQALFETSNSEDLFLTKDDLLKSL